MSLPVLSIEGLSLGLPARADRRYAVENATLQIEQGETLCVVGESGSGKSMMAHTVMGLLPKAVHVETGAIRLMGEDVLALGEAEMQSKRGREVSMIFQEPMTSLNPVMRIADQIMEAFEAHHALNRAARRLRTLEMLAEVGLPEPPRIARAYPHELSGGQRQRVMIAMALALEPKLLIADEPTTALDVTTQAQILILLQRLRKKHGMAILFITHDFGVVAEIADRIVVMQNGKLVEQGTADRVLSNPAQAYTRGLLAAVPSLIPPQSASPPSGKPILRVGRLDKTYRKRGFFAASREVKAVNDISFTLSSGETLGIVGESGSGKSTLGRCCVRLIEPDRGEIQLAGEDFRALSASALRKSRKRIQMIFQDPFASLNPRQTVGRIISDGPVAHGLSRTAALTKAKMLLELVGLSAGALSRYPHEFSGGQRQRIGIARALALEPDVLIADEAVSALDVSVQSQILALIKDIQAKLGLAILFVTHDLRVAAQMCDRIAVMQRGCIVELGPTSILFANPQHDYTRQLLGAVPGKGNLSPHSNGE